MKRLSIVVAALALLFGGFLWLMERGADPDRSRTPRVADRSTKIFSADGVQVEVTFLGEMSGASLLGDGAPFPLRPHGSNGEDEGVWLNVSPDWMEFEYSIGGTLRHVLIAKEPLARFVSWDAIARVGAALGAGHDLIVDGESVRQGATFTDRTGRNWIVRLPTCGRSTHAGLSEWNLLIGGVHEGDRDFAGDRYGWVPAPYSDPDLSVGQDGYLTWCSDRWRDDRPHRVTRGYYLVSRFHATEPHLATDRIVWRPVLERVPPRPERLAGEGHEAGEVAHAISSDGSVQYFGPVSNEILFGLDGRVSSDIDVPEGIYIAGGRPKWLRFVYDGTELLIAARPVRMGVSWEALARAGVVGGRAPGIVSGGQQYPQEAVVTTLSGTRYRVRLLKCGGFTLDPDSEWNRLLGALHEGDGDFLDAGEGIYGWIDPSMTDEDLQIGERPGAATWCQESEIGPGDAERVAVNRGYLTISRFHLTETHHRGFGFGWRPVLERID